MEMHCSLSARLEVPLNTIRTWRRRALSTETIYNVKMKPNFSRNTVSLGEGSASIRNLMIYS